MFSPKSIKSILVLISVFVFLLLFVALEIFIFVKTGVYTVILAIFIFSVLAFFILDFFIKSNDKKIERENTNFILMLVHKLKTSLAGMKWSLKMFADEDFGHITIEQKNIINKMRKKNDAMISSVHDLLDASTIDDGTHVYNMGMFSIEDVLKSVIFDYQEEIKRKSINFSFEKTESSENHIPSRTIFDKNAIATAIQNVLDNAIKYTPSHGIVRVFLQGNGKEINIKIQDSGIGIPEAKHNQIFKKFFRAENAGKIESSGTGLGLFITKNIVEAHGGKIWFESKENKGSTFYITLPIAFKIKM